MTEYDYKKLLELAKTRQAPKEPHRFKIPFEKKMEGKEVKHYIFFYWADWDEEDMPPEKQELYKLLDEGKIPNPFPIFEGEEDKL